MVARAASSRSAAGVFAQSVIAPSARSVHASSISAWWLRKSNTSARAWTSSWNGAVPTRVLRGHDAADIEDRIGARADLRERRLELLGRGEVGEHDP
jgi:hypothetical protein